MDWPVFPGYLFVHNSGYMFKPGPFSGVVDAVLSGFYLFILCMLVCFGTVCFI